MPYAPEAGDLIWADFDPHAGRERSGRRPALVVSPADFCRVTEFAIVCPITSRVRPFGTSVVLPMGLPVSGEILTSHVRSIDTLARPISYAGRRSRRNPGRSAHEVGRLDRALAQFVRPAKRIGGELTPNPIVRKLTFTGPTEIGKLLMEECAGMGGIDR